MSEQTMTELDVLARQLGLSDQAKTKLERLVRTQHQINRRTAEIEVLQNQRRQDVLFLIRVGVTRYRMAQLLDLSQTTLSNIVASLHGELPEDGSEGEPEDETDEPVESIPVE